MSDPVDVAKAVAREIPLRDVYVDAIQPGAQQVGHTIELVGRAINVALAPLELLIFKGEELRARFLPDLEQRLKNVPADQIQTPAPEVAGPLLEALRFSAGNDDLRGMYASLLATAMDPAVATHAHPAFVEIIKQLTSDEARILSKFSTSLPARYISTISVLRRNEQNGGASYRTTLDRLVDCVGTTVHPELVPQYVGNLLRLGILEPLEGVALEEDGNPDPRYSALEQESLVLAAVAAIESENVVGVSAEVVRGVLTITPFGEQFCFACVRA